MQASAHRSYSLTVVIVAYGSIPRPAKVNAVHTPIEVVHGVRVSTIWTRIAGFPFTAFSVFLEALRSLLLFLADAMLLIFLPMNPPRYDVRRGASRLKQSHGPFPQCLVIPIAPIPGRCEILIDQFTS
jgi:hypothetical protein